MHTVNFQMFELDLEKAEEPEIRLQTSVGSSKKQESSRKTSALLTTPKPLCASQQTVESSERDGNTRPPYLPPEKLVCRSRSSRTGQGTTQHSEYSMASGPIASWQKMVKQWKQ